MGFNTHSIWCSTSLFGSTFNWLSSSNSKLLCCYECPSCWGPTLLKNWDCFERNEKPKEYFISKKTTTSFMENRISWRRKWNLCNSFTNINKLEYSTTTSTTTRSFSVYENNLKHTANGWRINNVWMLICESFDLNSTTKNFSFFGFVFFEQGFFHVLFWMFLFVFFCFWGRNISMWRRFW